MDTSKKIYLIKELAPWMMEELISFSEFSKFEIIFFRKVSGFYENDLKVLKERGIKYHIKPFVKRFSFRNFLIALRTLITRPQLFIGKYNIVWTLQAVQWFLKLDKELLKDAHSTHAQFASQAAILAYFLKKAYGINYHFTFHAHDIYFKNRWFKSLVKSSNSAFSISEFNIKYVMKAYGVNRDKLILSRLGVKIPEKVNAPQNEKCILGFMSNLEAKKGIPYLLEAFHRLNQDHPGKYELWIAGSGEEQTFIEEFVEKNQLADAVKLLGRIRDGKKVEFFSTIDLFVLPSIKIPHDMDGIPVVLMEAISYKKPIISTDVSGIPEICVNNFDGKLIQEKNTDEIVQAIESLANNKDLLQELSTNSLELALNEYNLIENSKKKMQKMSWINN